MAGDAGRSTLRRPLLMVVVGATIVSLLARFVLLGDRVAHWDEARVAYWILDYGATGQYYYRPIIHGPFYHHVNTILFDLVGATDYTMRIAAALIGGLLPLSVLLLRDRLRESELAALAILLAANPILLYYSRFMRGDILVAAFSFLAFALVVRGIDVENPWYLLPAAVAMALGLTAKENGLVYLIAWIGAGLLVLDHRFLADHGAGDWWTRVDAATHTVRTRARRAAAPIVASVLAFFGVLVVFYAPRGAVPTTEKFYQHCNPGGGHLATMDGVVGFGDLLANPGAIPRVILASTVGPAELVMCQWVGGATGSEGNPYLDYLGHLMGTIAYGGAALAILAILGLLVDRYGRDRPRDVVMFATYWGVLSLAGYPLITDIKAPWAAVHVVLPLAIPAAVGAAVVYRWGADALVDDDTVSALVAFALLLLLVGQMAGMAAYTSYAAPQADDNELVQYAQPGGRMHPTLADSARLAAANEEGTDVLLYGDYFVDGEAESDWRPPCAAWFDSLPLPWYWERSGTNVSCASTPADLEAALADPPPVVVTRTSQQGNVSAHLEGYDARVYTLRRYGTETVFFIDRSRLAATRDGG